MNAYSNANSDANFSKWFTVRSTIIGGLSGLLFSLAQKQFRSAHRSLNLTLRVPGACGHRRFCALTRMQRRASCGSLYRYDDLPPPLAERHSLGQIRTHSLWDPSAGIHPLTFIPPPHADDILSSLHDVSVSRRPASSPSPTTPSSRPSSPPRPLATPQVLLPLSLSLCYRHRRLPHGRMQAYPLARCGFGGIIWSDPSSMGTGVSATAVAMRIACGALHE